MWEVNNLLNESDVEQKLVFPLLTESQPFGLGYLPEAILTKVNIKKHLIGKGEGKKLYYPDYLVLNSALPVMVVEAKTPGENLSEGYREARLYAAEINSSFASQVNPAKYVVAVNGIEIWYGYSDQHDPLGKILCANLNRYSPQLGELIDFASWTKLSDHAKSISSIIRPDHKFKPRRLIGGSAVQNEEISINSFGATVTSAISHIFNPQNTEDRINIVKNAYVSSNRRQRYINPIDRIIRAARPPSVSKCQGG